MIQLPAAPASQPTVHDLVLPIAVRIRAARRERSLTTAALAARAGVSVDSINQVERAARGVTADYVARVARGLGVDAVELYPAARPDAFWFRVGDALRHHLSPGPGMAAEFGLAA